MQLRISNTDGTPIYQQIVAQVRQLIASGRLQPGEELVPIRTLAEQLTINPNTVARAYLELERTGVVTKRHGSGTYVSEEASTVSQREKLKMIRQRVDALVVEAVHLNLDLDVLVEMVEERHRTLHPQTRQ
jgi:GntR family transcriptional regulator